MSSIGAAGPLIGMGCMRLSTERDRDEARAIAVLHAAFDAGATLLDTADAYCWDDSEMGQLHAPDPRTSLATSVRGLASLKRDGLLLRIGLCNVNVGQIEEARRITEIDAVQVELSVWNGDNFLSGVAEYCVEPTPDRESRARSSTSGRVCRPQPKIARLEVRVERVGAVAPSSRTIGTARLSTR